MHAEWKRQSGWERVSVAKLQNHNFVTFFLLSLSNAPLCKTFMLFGHSVEILKNVLVFIYESMVMRLCLKFIWSKKIYQVSEVFFFQMADPHDVIDSVEANLTSWQYKGNSDSISESVRHCPKRGSYKLLWERKCQMKRSPGWPWTSCSATPPDTLSWALFGLKDSASAWMFSSCFPDLRNLR